MDDLSTVTKVIGIGGAGINMVSGILNNDFREDAEFIVIDTDWRALNNSPVKNKIFLESAYIASLNTLRVAVGSASYVILLAGLGRRTGS